MIPFGSEPSQRQAHRVHGENSSAASAIVGRSGESSYPKFLSILAHTQQTIIFSVQPISFHCIIIYVWEQKKVASSQPPFLLVKPYTALSAHTSARFLPEQASGLWLLKREMSPMGSETGCCTFSSICCPGASQTWMLV